MRGADGGNMEMKFAERLKTGFFHRDAQAQEVDIDWLGFNFEDVESRRANDRKWTVILVITFLFGVLLLAYPSIANYWNNFFQARAIMNYADQVAGMSRDDYAKLIQDAEEYNRRLAKTGINWNMTEEQIAEYKGLLSFNNTGNMGYIDIPKIHIKLPVYHGISDEVLQSSIGHLQETSLPVGGSGSHCVLSGHRGLPSARLFSDLDKLVEGDVFTLSVLNETYSYEVDQIRVVSPMDISEIKILPGKDLCTLVTCTPYGVNTHRLLVRGHRVENVNGNAQVVADALQLEAAYVAPFIMIPFIVTLLLLLFVNPSKY
ncbi:MAG: class C sortase [Lachnospiraceae bacterium]|nr:class C sortase [Lachnospiraceae bacterium]